MSNVKNVSDLTDEELVECYNQMASDNEPLPLTPHMRQALIFGLHTGDTVYVERSDNGVWVDRTPAGMLGEATFVRTEDGVEIANDPSRKRTLS